jgi:hypothetical protein
MNELLSGHAFELILLVCNAAVAIVNNGIKSKLKEVKNDIAVSHAAMALSVTQLEARMFDRFLTKDDYYAHQSKKG